ncbi:MAG: polysaccharide deacetylase family protein [Gammaproteobacteria bacterium]
MMRSISALLSPRGRLARLPILIFHRVLPSRDPLRPGDPDAATFEWQMKLVARQFNVLPLSEACERWGQRSLPARALCITFDDGYADNVELALPILKRHGLHSTFFIATGFMNGGRMWNDTVIEWVRGLQEGELDLRSLDLGVRSIRTIEDKRSTLGAVLTSLKYLPLERRLEHVGKLVDDRADRLPTDLMMTDAQVNELLAEGMEVGGHTVNHPILARVDHDTALWEIQEGKRQLEEITGHAVRLFAYPNGKPGIDYGPEHVQMVREAGFAAAVSTAWGAGRRSSDLFQLPRFTPWQRSPTQFHMEMMRNYMRRGMPAAADSAKV